MNILKRRKQTTLKNNTRKNHKTKKSKKRTSRQASNKTKMPLAKRYKLLMNCVAPHLLPQKQITYPLNSITRGDYFSLSEKLIYAELYSMFEIAPKFQYHSSELSRVISLHKNVANIVGRTVHKLNHLKLITVDNVYDKSRKRKKPIGFVLHNTGILAKTVSYDLINHEAKISHKQKSINHLQGGLVAKEAQKIIEFLNKVAHRSFRTNNKGYIKAVSARLKEKYTVNDCKLVILYKNADWKNKPDMKKFIQPSTLFRPNNFDRYLTNAKIWKQSNPRLFNGNQLSTTDNSTQTEEGRFNYGDDF